MSELKERYYLAGYHSDGSRWLEEFETEEEAKTFLRRLEYIIQYFSNFRVEVAHGLVTRRWIGFTPKSEYSAEKFYEFEEGNTRV